MTNLRLVNLPGRLLSDTNLYGVNTVFFFSFNLGDLASVDLDHGARLQFAPLVPEVSHAHFVAH